VDSFNQEMMLRLLQIPGVVATGRTSFLPASGSNSNETFVVDGYNPPKGAAMNLATPSVVAGDYFRTMDIPLLRGRFFTEGDTAKAQLVAIVNRKLAQHYWPNQDPLGKRFRIGTPEMQTPWLQVVGEIADVKLSSPDVDAKEQFYQPEEQFEASIGTLADPADLNGNGGYIVLRGALPSERMENALRAAVRSIDRQLPLTQVATMEQVISDSEAPRRFNTAVITAFAIAAVLLAVLGIYSVIAFSVASRVQELSIRMALGSQRLGIVRLVLISGAKLACIGCAIGVLGAVAASSLMSSFLFGVSASDPVVLGLAAVAVLLLALAASALPAQRAASIDPIRGLRGE
jgi:putative ABC transport system permease protein